MKRRDWIKVRKDWWESPSHRLISPGARMFGVYLLYLADSDPAWRETGNARLVGPGEVALGSDDVSRLAGVRSRDGRRWVSELLSCGTLHESDSGVLSFPNYREHQENRSAKSMRKARNDVHSEHDREHFVNVEVEEEAEGEEEAEIYQKTTSSDSSPSGDSAERRKPRKVSELIDPMWDWFEAECLARGFSRQAKGLSADERGKISEGVMRHIRSTLGLGASREDTDRVVATMRAHLAWKLDQAELDRTSRKYIRTVAPWRRKSFDYWWTHVVDATEPAAPVGREPQTAEEADAYCREHGEYPRGWTFKAGGWVRK